ncbi:MAG: hypothetical protein ACI9QL_000180 [Candidatus Omnitrophota bacterium]|jgi:hypothetical protein
MDDKEEIVKRMAKIFIPFIGVLVLLYAMASYIETRDFDQARMKVQQAKLDAQQQAKREQALTTAAQPAPALRPEKASDDHRSAPVTNNTQTTVVLREGGENLLDQLDDETLALLEEVSDDLEGNALQRMKAGLQLVTQLNDNRVRAIDPEQLKQVLPEQLPGWKGGKITAKATSLLGIHTAMARRSYTDAKGRKVFIKLMDTASMKRVSALGATATGAADIVTETDEYIEKTIMIGSIPAFAKYGKKTKASNLHAFMLGRFIVEAGGSDVSIEELGERVSALNLHLLADFIKDEEPNLE